MANLTESKKGSPTLSGRRLEDYPDVLTITQAAAYLQVPRSTLYELVARKEIAAVKIGRHIRITRETLYGLLHLEER